MSEPKSAPTLPVWNATPGHLPNVDEVVYDVVIVGAGIVGCATAYWLRQLDRRLRVAVIDREGIAAGASGRNAGFLLLGTDAGYAAAVDRHGRENARRLWQFTEESRDLVNGFAWEAGVPVEDSGAALAAGSPDEAIALRHSARLLAEDGFPGDYLDSAEGLGNGFHGYLVDEEGGGVDPRAFVMALAQASGCAVAASRAANAISARGAGVRVDTSAGPLDASRACLTMNAYLPQLVPSLGDVVAPVRAQMLATEPLPPRLRAPLYSHEGRYYVRQLPTGEVLVGGARHLHSDAEVGYADETTAAVQRALEEYLQRHFPDWAGAEVRSRWSGVMGFAPGGLPRVGKLAEAPAALWAAGFTGHGIGFGMRMGHLLARRLVGEADPYDGLFETAL